LPETYDAIVAVPTLPREIQIQGNGGILALHGERKLSIKSRAVGEIEYEIRRVARTRSIIRDQTNGSFENPEFFGEFERKTFAHCDRASVAQSREQIQGELFRVRFLQSSPGSGDGGSERASFSSARKSGTQ